MIANLVSGFIIPPKSGTTKKAEAEQFALFIGYGTAAVLFAWMPVAILEQG